MLVDIEVGEPEMMIVVRRNDGTLTLSVSRAAFERAARQYFQNSAAIERSVSRETIAAIGELN